MDKFIQIYLIHNKEESRAKIMMEQFMKSNIDPEKVKWMLEPNREDITEAMVNKFVNMSPSICNGVRVLPSYLILRKGMLSCVIKHYLSLQSIVVNNIPYGVIIEDNIVFKCDMSKQIPMYIHQLNTLYPDWDIVFDSSLTKYIESPLKEGIYVYPKSNEITNQCHGGTKTAVFYIVTWKGAKKLYENYLPINHAPDWHMNELFRKLNIKSFWIEPNFVDVQAGHKSTADGTYVPYYTSPPSTT